MARIVLDAREFTTSTGRYMFKLIEHLQSLETAHEFIILLKPHDFATYHPTRPNFTTMRCPYKEFTFVEQLGFARQLYGLNADLVHFGMTQQPILYLKPSVTTVHDLTTLRFDNPSKNKLIFRFRQLVYGGVIRWAAHKSRRVITPTDYVRNDLARYSGVSASRIVVTHESADPIRDAPVPLPDLTKSKFIMYVGRPQPHKNLPRLLEAFTLLRRDHPELRLVLAGKADTLYTRLADGTDPQSVHFTGFVSDGQLRWLYEHCAAYVFPSLSEGFGLPALEAMSHGAPVACSNAACLPEVYGDAVHYFDPLSVDDMAAKIGDVIDEERLRKELIAKSRAKAAEYSWTRMARQTLKVYETALRESGVRRDR